MTEIRAYKMVTVTEDRLLQDIAHTMVYVLSCMHVTAEDWRLITHLELSRTVLQIVVFQVIMSAAITMHQRLTGGEENGWCSLRTLDIQFENYTTYNSALKVCGVHILNQVDD
jgi:hypothetical protein